MEKDDGIGVFDAACEVAVAGGEEAIDASETGEFAFLDGGGRGQAISDTDAVHGKRIMKRPRIGRDLALHRAGEAARLRGG